MIYKYIYLNIYGNLFFDFMLLYNEISINNIMHNSDVNSRNNDMQYICISLLTNKYLFINNK